MHVCEEYIEEKVRVSECVGGILYAQEKNSQEMMFACMWFAVWARLTSVVLVSPIEWSCTEVCVVCWLSLQYVCWNIGTGDTERWGTVTPSDRHGRDSQAWECPQSKPRANYSCNLRNCQQRLLKLQTLHSYCIFFSFVSSTRDWQREDLHCAVCLTFT